MSTTFIILLLLIAAVLVAFVFMAKKSRHATAPGLLNDRLRPCPNSPNCVCSESSSGASHSVEPFAVTKPDPIDRIKSAVIADGGRIVDETETYLATVYVSTFFGFSDDVEFRHDPDSNLVHVRSASRTGRSDLGANRKRIEKLRARLN